MARVQYGGGVTSFKGSIVGNTFQQNRSGAIVRARSGTGKAGTLKQMLARQTVVKYNALWQQLIFDAQNDWNDFADLHDRTNPFGEVTTLSGINWHQSINYNIESFGGAYTALPPFYTLPPAVAAYSVQLTASNITIIFDTPFSPANSGLIIWITAPTTRVSTSLRSEFRICLLTQSAPFDNIDITTEWNTATGLNYGAIAPGSKFQIGVMIQTCELTSGLASPGSIVIAGGFTPPTGIGFMVIGTDFTIT